MQFKVLSRHSAVQMEEGLAEKWFTMAGGGFQGKVTPQ